MYRHHALALMPGLQLLQSFEHSLSLRPDQIPLVQVEQLHLVVAVLDHFASFSDKFQLSLLVIAQLRLL